MCGHHVIDSVARRMLSRRNLFAGAGGALAAGAVTTFLPPAPAEARTITGTVSDLTHTLTEGFPTFSGSQQLEIARLTSFEADGYNVFSLTVNEHTGTHMDAPLHFSEDGQAVDAIPPENLVAPLVVVDIAEKAARDPDAEVTPDDLNAWIDTHGPIPERACVAMHSGWATHVNDPMFRNADADGVMHFPGFHIETAQMLLEETSAVGLAVDTLSLDYGQSTTFAVHYAWPPTNRWGLECVAGLEALPPAGATIMVGAPKHAGGSGGPTRVLALA